MSDRIGKTSITSISISHDFAEMIKKYNLSPTDIFRAGMGVTLYELGVKGYTSILLRRKALIAKKFVDEYKKNIVLQEVSVLLEELNTKIIDALEYEKENNGKL